MAGPEEIPENKRQAFPCDCGGNITKGASEWFCDNCDWTPGDTGRLLSDAPHPGFEGVNLAEWKAELSAESSAGNQTAAVLLLIAEKVGSGDAVGVEDAAFLLGYIKHHEVLRADLVVVQS